MGDFFTDTMIGLIQAVNIEKGNIPMKKVENMPAETYRVSSSYDDETEEYVKPIQKVGQQ